ncbi:Uncharacterized protein FKW44_003417, partial [Caligus rogercresseyi]
MVRELGILADLQTAEFIMENNKVTVGFDTTTQEHIHINSIHFTSDKGCMSAAVDELPGGTAVDYSLHISSTLNHLVEVFINFHPNFNFSDTRNRMIQNIRNSMTDRCPAIHATIQILNSEWGVTLNELNCNLHPLDAIASKVKATIKSLEKRNSKLLGPDCMAVNLITQINKLRYKNGKGDPKGFVLFLKQRSLPNNLLPRYRGNRLHVLFHIAGKLLEHEDQFSSYFKTGTACGGLRNAICIDFSNEYVKTQLHVLAIFRKLLTGPWMKKFYTNSKDSIDYVDSIKSIKEVILNMKKTLEMPGQLIKSTKDLFGENIPLDSTIQSLHQRKILCADIFEEYISQCIYSIISVLEKQYHKFVSIDITKKFSEETASARLHNMDAEELIGMFSQLKKKSPRSTIDYISCKMRAAKNCTFDFINNKNLETQDTFINISRQLARASRLHKLNK